MEPDDDESEFVREEGLIKRETVSWQIQNVTDGLQMITETIDGEYVMLV